jgi:serine/threonine-protein kinase
MEDLDARLIPGPPALGQNWNPVFSPDAESIAYVGASGQLHRIAVGGGAPALIARFADPSSSLQGMSWGAENTVLYSVASGIWRVSGDGGTPERIIPASEGEWMGSPRLLPGGDSVLFSVFTAAAAAAGPVPWDQAQIVVQSLRTGARKVVWQGGSDARYVPTGHLVFVVGNDLFAVAFDLDQLAVRGRPVPVVQGVQRGFAGGAASYGVSDGGTLVYLPAGTLEGGGGLITTLRRLVWVTRDGREEPLALPPRAYSYPRLSPDGTRIAVDVRDAESDIWVWSLERATLTRLTFHPLFDRFPLWFETSASFVARNPAMVFKGQYAPSLGGRNYDASPDGRRFLMLKVGTGTEGPATPRARVIVVENWTEELTRLVPGN